MKELPQKYNRSWLLKNLPKRDWNKISTYKKLFIVPAGTKHDSGYMHIAIIGVNDNKAEIVAYPDDISWDYSGIQQKDGYDSVRTDCYYPSGILQFWSRSYKFMIEGAYSSTTIKIINN